MTTDIIFIIVFVAIAVLGYLVGFGRSLKLATKGVFGIVISIFVCAMLGGALMGIGAVRSFIENIDAYFSGFWSFLSVIHFGTIVYYLSFFLLVQAARAIIVGIICKITESENKGVKIVNKILGVVFVPAFCLGLLLLAFAGLKAFEDSAATISFLAKVENSFLLTLYTNNPIVF